MVFSALLAFAAFAQQPAWSQPPISYGETRSRDAVARLDVALGAGELSLRLNGEPDFAAGSTYVDPSTPFEKRWGGWYVTGSVGELAHIGNKRLAEGERELVPTARRYRSLAGLCDTAHYPVDTSDVVALLVLEHQTHVQNALVLAPYEARRALECQRALHSMAMKTLPPVLRDRVWTRLGELFDGPLAGGDSAAYGAVINADAQRAVRAIVERSLGASRSTGEGDALALRLFLGPR